MLASTEQTSTPATLPSTVILRTADLTEFAVPVSQVMNSGSIVSALTGTESPLRIVSTKGDVPTIEVAHASSLVLSKVLAYMSLHQDPEYDEKTFKCSDSDFEEFDALPNEQLLQIAFTANYLDIPALLHITGEVLAKKLNGHTDEEVRNLFNLESIEVTGEKMEAVNEEDLEGGDWDEMEDMDVEEKSNKTAEC